MSVQNLAVKLCGILQSESKEEITAREWRLLGQEQDGTQILSWVSTNGAKTEQLNIGVYTNKTKYFFKLHTFQEKVNIIQASVNASHSLLVYVIKELPPELSEKEALYCPYLLSLEFDNEAEPIKVEEPSTKQIMMQYVYGKSYKYTPGYRNDRFLLLKHLEYINIFCTTMTSKECDDGTEEWSFDGVLSEPETIVGEFMWAQWDCVSQVLYYIHYRAPTQRFAEEEAAARPAAPTLSALQLHAALPHETVLNIPLSLPQLPAAGGAAGGAGGAGGAAGGADGGAQYEDDPVPLRVHDCHLDLLIVADAAGPLCICHHYLYKPLDESTGSPGGGVHFAYSVTALHRGAVLHAAVADLPWPLARALRPSYVLYDEHHLLVTIPMLYTHLLDLSLAHEACCHLVLPPADSRQLAAAPGWGARAVVDLATLDVRTLAVLEKDLVATFKTTGVENKLAIVHYLIQHEGNIELAEELISWMCLNQRDGYGSLQKVMEEYLVSAAYALTARALPAAAAPLVALLPFTCHLGYSDVKYRDTIVTVTAEKLWNSGVMVLAPRQRVCQFAEDSWTRLWAILNPARETKRFQLEDVRNRLRDSLHCYQPEALSRCSTPRSPTAAGPAFAAPRRASAAQPDTLPFLEVDVCTASKQEHVMAANVRELSVHLTRATAGGAGGAAGGAGGGEGAAHAAAVRWSRAQLDASRALCRAVCRAAAPAPANNQQRGLCFVQSLPAECALVLHRLLQQYRLACARAAAPQPLGLESFAALLARRALPPPRFVLAVHRRALDLNIDVLKVIVSAKPDTERAVAEKLRLVQLAGGARARRALHAWDHPAARAVRARLHAAALLGGEGGGGERAAGGAAPGRLAPARVPPLDTFLALLTAKASLHELDFNLIIDATLASMDNGRFA